MKNYFSWIIVSCLIIIGCGGGGGGSSAPPLRPHAETSGYAVDAVIEGGTVTAYTWQKGVKGEVLGTGLTDENGYYSILIQAAPQPVLLELTGGSYIEEASGERVTLKADQFLYAAINYGGGAITVMITPYTTMATALTEYYVSSGDNVENAITKATSEITGITVFNILEEYPVNITNAANRTDELLDGHMYGFFCAALSSWAAQLSEENGTGIHEIYTSIYLTQLMYRDLVHDGVFNAYGIAPNDRPGTISAGSIPLDSQSYRFNIGLHILKAAGAEYNATGLTVDDVLEQAHLFSQRVNALFGNEDPLPLDVEGPKVYRTEPIGKQFKGVADFGFRIVDPAGIKSMSVSLGGDAIDSTIPENSTDENIVVTIDTTAYSDGEHTLTIVASDLLGNESTSEQTVIIRNKGILLNVDELPTLTNEAAVTVGGTYEETGTPIDTITVNDAPATIQKQNQTWSTTYTLQPGMNEIVIVATDTIGNESIVNRTIEVDRVAPEIFTGDDHGHHRFYIGENETGSLVLHDENSGYPLFYNYYNTSLNGITPTREELLSAEIPYFIFTASDPAGDGVYSDNADMTVEIIYYRDGQELSNRTIPLLSGSTDRYLIPLVTEYLGQEFYQVAEDVMHSIQVTVTDQAGNASVKIFTFKVYVDANELTISSLNAGSTVSVYAFDSGNKEGLIGSTTTNEDGSAVIKMFTEPRPILIELTAGHYHEIGTGNYAPLKDGQSLCAVTQYLDTDLTVSVTPLTHTAYGLAGQKIASGTSVHEAISSANSTVSDIYGVDVVDTPVVDISDPNNASTSCSAPYTYSFALAGISKWTGDADEANNGHGQENYNSVLMASRMAADIGNDGILNGAESFGAVPINQATYQTGIGNATLEAIDSPHNETQLTAQKFVGVTDTPRDLMPTVFAGVTFANRTSIYGKTHTTYEVILRNDSVQQQMLKIDNPGLAGGYIHEYFDAVKIHKVRETQATKYQARYKLDRGGSYSPWKAITNYQAYENGRWERVQLSLTANRDFSHPSDTLPKNKTVPWAYFIREAVGDAYTLSGDAGMGDEGGGGCYINFYDYKYGTRTVDSAYYKRETHPQDCSSNLVNSRVAANRATVVTPQIQRYITYTYTTTDGPRVHNGTVRNTSAVYKMETTVVTRDGSPVVLVDGYYAIRPGETVIIKKNSTFPNLPRYRSGNPDYTNKTFDKSITFSSPKTLQYSIGRNLSPAQRSQAPIYQNTITGKSTQKLSM